MERQKLVISTIVCTLLFSYGSVASTHMYAQGLAAQSVLMQPSYAGIDFESAIAATVGGPQFNGVAEFARQVSGFQHELGGGFSGSQASSSIGQGQFLSATPERNITSPAKSEGVAPGESGTLILITLGFAALGLSRRKVKFAALGNNKPTSTGESYPMNSATAEAYDLNTSRFRQFVLDAQATSACVEDSVTTPEPVKTTESEADRNPYPELAQSVQKLEALAHEMAHFQ